jgi:hypothetical protein
MSLIDSSYFIGPLTVAQLGQQSVRDNLNLFINRAEPQYLEAALGYDLWQDFLTGLAQPVIDPRWLALLNGVKFTSVSNWPNWYVGFNMYNWYYWLNSQRSLYFPGFATQTTFVSPTPLSPTITLIAGNPTGNPTPNVPNPVVGANSYTWSGLANATYTINRRGVGPLILNVDYALSNNNQTFTLLAVGDKWGAQDVLILTITSANNVGAPSNQYVSPIAGYVYYLWVRDQISMNTGAGIVQPNPENAQNANPSWRMVDAWSQMVQDTFKLWQYLEAMYVQNGPTYYVNYDRTKINYPFFQPINTFNI